MAAVLDFIRAALPWIVIGLFLAIAVVKKGLDKTEDEAEKEGASQVYDRMVIMPSIAAFVLAALEMVDGKTSSATTWFILAIAFFFIGRESTKK